MTTRRNIRKVFFLFAVLFILLGPFYRQVLEGESFIFRPWIMFTDRGVGTFLVDFHEFKSDGTHTKIDYMEVLGHADTKGWREPKALWRLSNWEEGVLKVGSQLCQKLGQQKDIRVYARRAAKHGWEIYHEATENLCARSAPSQ